MFTDLTLGHRTRGFAIAIETGTHVKFGDFTLTHWSRMDTIAVKLGMIDT